MVRAVVGEQVVEVARLVVINAGNAAEGGATDQCAVRYGGLTNEAQRDATPVVRGVGARVGRVGRAAGQQQGPGNENGVASRNDWGVA